MGVFVKINRDIETTRVFDLKKIVAKRMKRLLWGGGYITSSSSESNLERVNAILDFNSAYDLFNTVEESISTRTKGNQLVAVMPITRNGKGDIRLDFIDMDSSQITYSQNGRIIYARTTKALVEYGDAKFNIQQVWTINKMITRVNMLGTYGASTEIPVGQFNATVPEYLREPEEWNYSDLEEIPLFNFTNTPSVSGTDESDSAAVEQLQYLVDAATQAVYKELRNNSTRVIHNASNNNRRRNGTGGIDFDLMNSDLFMSLGKQKNIDPTQAQQMIEILQGDPKLDSYGDFISWAIDQAIVYSGLAAQGDSDANRTSAGTIFTKTGDVETTRFKRQLREDALKGLVKVIMDVDSRWNFTNYTDDEVSITIKENKVFDDQFKLEKLQLGTSLGLYTKEEQISILKDTDDEEFIKENIAQLEEQKKELQEQMGTNDSTNEEQEQQQEEVVENE